MIASSHAVRREIVLYLACAALVLSLTSAVCIAGATAADPLKAAQTALADLEQNPPAVPADWSHAKDLNDASKKFVAWQKAMLEERQEMERQQWRQFNQKLKVPPPLPPSETPDEPAMVKLNMPLPLPTDLQLSLSMGAPSASLSIGGEAKALSFLSGSYKAGVSYAAKDNKWLVGDAVDFKAAFEAGDVTAAGTYQYHSCTWGQAKEDDGKKPAGLEFSAELFQVKGALGYNTQNELSVGAGYDFLKTPKAWSKLAEASVGVEAQVAAPVKVNGFTRGSRGLSSTIAKYSAKVAKLLTSPADCPHCSAKGEMDCGTCGNTRTVICPKCNGKLQFSCGRCEGGGELICTNCNQTGSESCGSCGGSGSLRCRTCGGGGQVTRYESEIRSREVRKLLSAGFDENGDPYEEWGYETEYYSVDVPKNETCGSCGGSGDGGQCGSCGGDGDVTCHRCGGGGTVACGRCGGSGSLKCGKCRGSGKVACPECRGKPIRCPLCKGKKELGS
ncbi:MAG: hypothetical protein ACM3VT_14160 [Solirubrobacterales bacterium]